ncbi:uncharacterized protein RCC_00573 [Ramularia collo-cygni]|uniref:Uncharacterized protein n=1 Tax=Ramularia collo-cygni TaxID=112498 RepID=A0A2D3UN38_9PEZI|nr:uncharacterized protein RCC_00573 [Ramularia collo-cygni]CZT14598.1 uncharacterized protein RCC_00573 [Ramularia collo-cygni]
MQTSIATIIAFCAISVLAAPPARRDEWQPTTSTASWPEGAPIPAPTDHPNTEWQPQGNQTCIYITSNYQWTGYGINLCNTAGVCADKLPDGLSGKVMSAGPSLDQVCFLYSDQYCTGERSEPIFHPGYGNLDDIGFANMAESWKCFKVWPTEDSDPPSSVVPSSAPSSSAPSSSAPSSSAPSSSAPSSSATSSAIPSVLTTTFTTTISTPLTMTITTTTTVLTVQTVPVGVSTTRFAASDPQTTPGGLPISRTQSAVQVSSIPLNTPTLTPSSVPKANITPSMVSIPRLTPTAFNPMVPGHFSMPPEICDGPAGVIKKFDVRDTALAVQYD